MASGNLNTLKHHCCAAVADKYEGCEGVANEGFTSTSVSADVPDPSPVDTYGEALGQTGTRSRPAGTLYSSKSVERSVTM